MKIALAFSGGGYRASAFNLGVLTYLNRVQLTAHENLLSKVVALSTVSGGTITGARYAVGIKKGESLEDIYAALYKFFLDVDLITHSIAHLKSSDKWADNRIKSLINAFADLYDAHLFHEDKLGVLFESKPIHLKHISFNATEFSTGLQFRFQVSAKIKSAQTGRSYRGVIGNSKNKIPAAIAKEIRMADILAASSCFPGGFEPINFPDDFILPDTEEIRNFKANKKQPIGLMDGGIVDNQGIEPLLHMENRMQGAREPGDTSNVIDLIIISDVSSPYMEEFRASTQKKENWWRKLTLRMLRNVAIFIALLSLSAVVIAVMYKLVAIAIAATFFFTLSAIVLSLFGIAYNKLKRIKKIDMRKVKGLVRLKLVVFENLIVNRLKSMMKLTGSVFMKRLRKLNFRMVWEDSAWENRRIMNAIYELRAGETKTEEKFRKGELPDYMKPSEKIYDVTQLAAAMDTTLWFEQRHRDKRMPDALIACGQYTMCWNLLEYIEHIKHNQTNINKHKALFFCEQQLKNDWERFKINPYWMAEEYNAHVGTA